MDESTSTLSNGPHKPGSALHAWGPFRLIERVGTGGFGEVYLAFEPALQREVAVKLLLADPEKANEQQEAAIVREARSMARVTHPNLVQIYGVAIHEGRAGFWSSFVRGKSLSALLAINGPFGPGETVHIGVDLCRALSAIHAAGLLHRDIKAANAMREEGGRILLMDFGLTQPAGEQTFQGGTSGYMAPELRAGQEASIRTDIYALGVLLYHLLTGAYPQAGDTSEWSLLEQRPDLPAPLVRVVHMAIHRDAAQRFASAAAMASALSEAMGESVPERAPKRRAIIYAMALMAAAGLAGLGYYFTHYPRLGVPAAIHQRFDKAHDLVQHYYRLKALETAIPELGSIFHAQPTFAAAAADLGRANFLQFWQLRDTKYVEPASQASLSAIALDANLASPHVTLGMLYTQQGKNDEAAQELDTAIRIDRLNAEAWGARAELYLRQGRTEDVEPALRKAIDLAPYDWRWPKQLADYYERTGHKDLAIAEDRECVRLAPDNARAYNNLGLHLQAANRLPEARAALMKSVEIGASYNSYANLGRVQLDLGDYSGAANLFQQAINLNPSDYRAWGMLARVERLRGSDTLQWNAAYRKAIELGEALRRTKPRDPPLLVNLGTMYAAIGDSEHSIPLLRQSMALDSADAQIFVMSTLAFESLHRRSDAIQAIGSAIRRGYSKTAIEADPELASLRADKNYVAMVRSLR